MVARHRSPRSGTNRFKLQLNMPVGQFIWHFVVGMP
jgi:hypothetical protein